MISLHDASRRLQMPVEVIWNWIVDGSLQAHLQNGRGFGMEYYLDSEQLKHARELRDAWKDQPSPPPDAPNHEPWNVSRGPETRLDGLEAAHDVPNGTGAAMSTNASGQPKTDRALLTDAGNVITFRAADAGRRPWFSEGDEAGRKPGAALVVMRNLGADIVAAARAESRRETSMLDMAGAVEAVLLLTVEAIEHAQASCQARLAAQFEDLRARLAGDVQSWERDDRAFQDELNQTKDQLAVVLGALSPAVDDFSTPSEGTQARES